MEIIESVAPIVKLSLPFDVRLKTPYHWFVELIVTAVIDNTPAKLTRCSRNYIAVLSLAIKVPDMSVFACPEPEISPLNVGVKYLLQWK